MAEQFGDADGSFVVDETGFLKKGTKSVGVQRQDTGTAGKTENRQDRVFLTNVGPQRHAFLDRRFYLPQTWAEDAARRAEAAVPEAVTFQTKPELAWAMLEHAWDLGVPGPWVTADTVYGQDPTFRARLDGVAARCRYVLAVAANADSNRRPERTRVTMPHSRVQQRRTRSPSVDTRVRAGRALSSTSRA